MWVLKHDSTNDRSKSPLEEKVFAVIPFVPLLLFLYDNDSFMQNNKQPVLHNGGFYGKSPQKSSTTVSQLL
jgi:hypothetical protein